MIRFAKGPITSVEVSSFGPDDIIFNTSIGGYF